MQSLDKARRARRTGYKVSALALGVALASQANAQSPSVASGAQPDAGGLADIVVTARRTSESLQKTPISITAFNAQTLEKLNVQSVDKIAQVAPNVIINQQSGALSAASINIRGIGQTDPSFALDTAVGIYLDGVYVARSAGSIFDLVDLERIEVLRGPQGTLFGRNTTGGAVQLVSKKPADEFGLTVKGTYGTRNNRVIRGRVDTGKIGGSPIAASFTYLHRDRDGYFDNTLTPSRKDPGALHIDALAASLRADLDQLQLSYSYDYDHRTGTNPFFQTAALSPAALAYYGNSPALGGPPLQFIGSQKRLNRGQQQPAFGDFYTSKTVSQGHNVSASYAFSPALTVKSITGFRKLHLFNALGLSGNGDLKGLVLNPATGAVSVQSVTPYNGFNGPQNQRQFSQEFQALGTIGDFSYVGGLYYFKERVSEDNNQMLTFIIDAGTAGAPFYLGINLDPRARYRATSASKAAFGQVSWRPGALDEKLEATGGIRYTEDRKRLTLQNTTGGVPDASNGSDRVGFHNTSFLGSLSYQFTPSILAYGKVSTGYKSGGFNPRASGLVDATGNFIGLNSFAPEKLTSYEIGIKAEFFDHRLRINAAAFDSQYKDLQVAQFASGTGGASTLLVNAGSAQFRGFELEITALPVRGLTLSGSLGYTDPKYKQFLFLDPSTNTFGNIADIARFPNVAKFTSNVAAEYDFPAMSFGQIQARVSYAYRGHVYFYPNDRVNIFNKAVDSAATNNVDARLSLTSIPLKGRATAEFSVFGENLLNEDQVLYGVDFGGLGFGGKIYAEPRRMGVELKVTY